MSAQNKIVPEKAISGPRIAIHVRITPAVFHPLRFYLSGFGLFPPLLRYFCCIQQHAAARGFCPSSLNLKNFTFIKILSSCCMHLLYVAACSSVYVLL